MKAIILSWYLNHCLLIWIVYLLILSTVDRLAICRLDESIINASDWFFWLYDQYKWTKHNWIPFNKCISNRYWILRRTHQHSNIVWYMQERNSLRERVNKIYFSSEKLTKWHPLRQRFKLLHSFRIWFICLV